MTLPTTSAREPLTLDEAAAGLLGDRIDVALRLARRSGRAVASVSVAVPAALDLSAAVLAARGPADRFFCIEQPGRDEHAVCGLGTAVAFESSGPQRFVEVAAECRALAARTVAGDSSIDPGRPPGAGPIFVGGFAFDSRGGWSPEWASFAPAQMVLPEVSLARQGGEARMTVNVALDGHEGRGAVLQRVRDRLAGLHPAPMPLLDPDPVARARVAGAAPPSHYEEAVRRAVERIRAGELDKVVLAREVRVHSGAPTDPAPVLDALRAAFADCYCYCVGSAEAAFVGASPELLVRRDGSRAQSVALAGTTRRSADPAVDLHLGEQLLQSDKNRMEQAIVARRIERTLDPVSLWVAAGEEPVLVKVQNVQHLATPIRAQLARPVSTVELAGRLHPTPAVGGEPAAVAAPLIPALEGLDRGWYAGAVGWTDLTEDGEFCVALRCALLRGPVAHLYAGCGIVADSIPAEELAETEVKLEALLPLLT
ncbi:MAG: isochorismate synthase [Actinomycetota bacterium]|nr:isochorismate synthase [Actinomycetota bacterium]